MFAFHMEVSPGYKIIEETFYEHEKCGLKEIDYLNLDNPWFGIPKNSPFKEIFKVKYVSLETWKIENLVYKGPVFNYGQAHLSILLTKEKQAFIVLYIYINFSLFKIREHGIQSRVVSKIYHKRPVCNAHGQSFDSVRLIDCYAALLVLLYGFLASFVVMIGEKVAHSQYFKTKCQRASFNREP